MMLTRAQREITDWHTKLGAEAGTALRRVRETWRRVGAAHAHMELHAVDESERRYDEATDQAAKASGALWVVLQQMDAEIHRLREAAGERPAPVDYEWSEMPGPRPGAPL